VRALARLRSESITVNPVETEVGSALEWEVREITLRLTNNTGHPISIMGGTRAGYCKTTVDLPTTIEAWESQSIRVQVTFRGGIGRFKHPFVLYTDDQQQPIVTASFSGRILRGQ
jgi:hypothetical protein